MNLDCTGEGVAGPGLGLRAGGGSDLGLDLGIFLLERGGDGDGELGLGLDLGVFLSERDGDGEEDDEADLPKKDVI